MFKLPELPQEFTSSQNNSENDIEDMRPVHKHWIDIDTFNEKDKKFLSLPADVRHDILTDIKENNKRTSWKKLYVTPAENGEFSKFQIQRVLKRRSLQVSLEEAKKEMGGHSLSLGDLEALLCQEGIVTASKMAAKRRIASDENSRFLFIKSIQQTKKEITEKMNTIKEETKNENEESMDESLKSANKLSKIEIKNDSDSSQDSDLAIYSKNELNSDFESDLEKAIQLSKQELNTPSTSSIHQTEKQPHLEKVITKVAKSEADIVDNELNEPSTSFITNTMKQLEYDPDLEKALKLSLSEINSSSLNSEQQIQIKSESSNQLDLETGEAKNHSCEDQTENTNIAIKEESPDLDLEKAIKLSLEAEKTKENDVMEYLNNFKDGDFEFDSSSDDEILLTPVAKGSTSLARAYLTEYSDLTPLEIEKFLNTEKSKSEIKSKDFYLNEMLLNTPERKKPTEQDVKELLQDLTSDTEEMDGIGVISDSDESDDFVEVNESKESKPVLEVVIKPENEGIDDLFADVFETNQKSVKISIEKSISTEKTYIENEVLENIPENENKTVTISKTSDLEKVNNNEKLIATSETTTEKEKEKLVCINETIKEKINDEKSISNKEDLSVEKSTKPKISKEELINLKENLEAQRENLLKEKAHEERMANSITDQMYKDTQHLLQLFGVPYIIAPKEAEAQCAFLDEVNLTDGTITDDSDIWLFGGKTVYKNFFNHKKHVMEFRAENIQHHFKMSRQQLILLALLVGSDYTLGIQGIGPVTALEILAAFPPSKQETTILSQDELISGLRQFKQWWQGGRVAGPGKASLRNKLKNISLLEGFPSIQVINAYLQPEVDSNKETFSWGKPNLEKLREFARQKFGWSEVKCNEILMPVMKRWEDPKSQKSILAYFNKRPLKNAEILLSKRVKNAVTRLGQENSDDNEDVEEELQPSTSSTKTKSKATKTKKETKTKRAPKKRKPGEPEVVTLDVDVKPLSKLQEKLVKFEKPAPKTYEEIIPQREKDRINALKTKLRAIELYRKSKAGPGYVPKKQRPPRKMKDEAELSEDSD
ncbi:DNA excision repair protein ERCC-5 homolog isoform X2 [Chrysoperla carnea]|nr:DNA excision repair protein ERCC-5 homolog isoform X2 [Chrysoperla carnea]